MKHQYFKILIFLLLLFLCSKTFAQDSKTPSFLNLLKETKEDLKKTQDVLNKKSLNELYYIVYNDSSSIKKSTLAAQIFLQKAKADTSQIQVAIGYHNMSYISYLNESYELRKIYLDSLIDYSENLNLKKYPAYAYLDKGAIYIEENNYNKSLDSYLEVYELATKHNQKNLINYSLHNIAMLKSRIGDYKGALEIFIKDKKYLDKENKNKDADYLSTLYGLSLAYRKLNKIDSSRIINQKGIEISKKKQLIVYYGLFVLNEGINLYEEHKFETSLDSIKKGLSILQNENDEFNIVTGKYYLAKNYLKLKEKDKAISYLKQVDSIFIVYNDLNPDLRDTYEILINHYKEEGDRNSQLNYVNRLIKLDSILFSNYKYLNKNISSKYDVPELVKEKEILIDQISSDRDYLNILLIILTLIIVFVVISFLIHGKRRKKMYRLKFEKLMQSDLYNKEVSAKKNTKELNLPENVIKQIVEKLQLFEENLGFIYKEITLNSLSKKLNSNSKYVSKVINHNKNKTFVNYINDLRIEYIIDQLKNDKVLRNYTIKAISDKAGFKNAQSFSQAFYKKTEIYPSFFIKKLNDLQ